MLLTQTILEGTDDDPLSKNNKQVFVLFVHYMEHRC